MNPGQWFAIMAKALQLALLMIPECVSGAKKRHSNRLKLFGCIAVAARTVLLVYHEGNLGHGSPRLQLRQNLLRKLSKEQWLLT